MHYWMDVGFIRPIQRDKKNRTNINNAATPPPPSGKCFCFQCLIGFAVREASWEGEGQGGRWDHIRLTWGGYWSVIQIYTERSRGTPLGWSTQTCMSASGFFYSHQTQTKNTDVCVLLFCSHGKKAFSPSVVIRLNNQEIKGAFASTHIHVCRNT